MMVIPYEMLILIIIVALGGWRLAVLLNEERGPFNIMVHIRSRFRVEHSDDGTPFSYPDRFPGSVFACAWCMTFWTCIAVFGILLVIPEIAFLLAAWAIACLIHKVAFRS